MEIARVLKKQGEFFFPSSSFVFVYLPFRLVLESKGILSERKGTVPVLRLIN